MKKRFCLPVFIIAFLLLTAITTLCVRGSQSYTITGNYEKADYKDYLTYFVGYDRADNGFKMIGDDPQLHFDFSDAEVCGIRLKFTSPIEVNQIQFFPGRDEPTYFEGDSFIIETKNSDVVEVTDVEEFQYLRVDINGDFSLDSLEVAFDIEKLRTGNVGEYFVAVILSGIIATLLAFCPQVKLAYEEYGKKGKRLLSVMKANKKTVIVLGAGTVIIPSVALIAEFAYVYFTKQINYNEYRALTVFAFGYLIFLTLLFRKQIYKYAHIYIFVAIMLLGTVQVIGTPSISGTVWDGEIHYGRTAFLSWRATDQISFSDNKLINQRGSEVYTAGGRYLWEKEINDYSEENNALRQTNNYKLSVQYIAYVPSAIGLSLARGIGLDFIGTFMFGKWVNLLVYATIISCAAYVLKKGKMIVMALGLIPTNIFLAASYAYDAWVTAFVILGYAFFIGTIQQKTKISTRRMIAILAIMIIGMLPKAIYFPLIFPLFLFGKDRYENSKLSRILVWVAMFLLVLTFALPYLTGAGGYSDVRGGADVNAIEQARFILTQPLEYTKILLKFLCEYLSLDASYQYLTFYAYIGVARYYTVCMVAIVICCVLDTSEEKMWHKTEGRMVNGGVLLATFGTIVLVATSLYVSFTPVAYHTINGCQPRYLLPVLFPFLFFFSRMGISVSEKVKGNVMAVSTVVMAFVYLYGMFTLCIGVY